MSIEPTTNFRDSNGVDLGKKLITKDYLISVYPSIGQEIGISPELWTWGYGTFGSLGNGVNLTRSTPVTTTVGGTNWKQCGQGRDWGAGLKKDGKIWTWGQNNYGQLGRTGSGTPAVVSTDNVNWKSIAVGYFHTAAIKTDGTLWTWGFGAQGQLGNANTTNISTPTTTFAGGNNWKQVSCGRENTVAIKTDGTLWTWGRNYFNGDNNNVGDKSTPVTTFAGGTNWKQVNLSLYNTIAIKTDGTLWTWGQSAQGQLGNASLSGGATPVTTFAGGTNWKQASAGRGFCTAIKSDGSLWIWGNCSTGQLGNNISSGIVSTPITTFAGGNNWKQVSCGGSHTAAIKTDGTLWTWGNGTNVQLGTLSSGNRLTPVTTFLGGNDWKQVDGGDRNTSAIRSRDF